MAIMIDLQQELRRLSANVLINFSDVDGLYQSSKNKIIIKEIKSIDEKIYSFIDNKKAHTGLEA